MGDSGAMSWAMSWEEARGPRPEPAPPEVPGYEVGELLGAGAMATVWSAVRWADGLLVALKVVPGGAPADVDAALRELAVLRAMDSEHLLRVHDALGLPSGDLVLVLDHLAGGSLRRVVTARGHLGPKEAVTVLSPVASALGRLHAAAVVHGDVSPGNVLFDRTGRPVLADLGTARVAGLAVDEVHGTDGFVAPEVLAGAEPSPAADVYAVGALGWYCLTGEVPGPAVLRGPLGAAVTKLRRSVGAGEDEPLDPAYEALVAVLERCLATDPDLRPTAVDVALEIFACAEPEPLRFVLGADGVSALTHRIRAVAARESAIGDRGRRGRHVRPGPPRAGRAARLTRRAWVVLASLALLVTGALVASVVGSRSTRAAATETTPPASVAAATAVGRAGELLTDRRAPGAEPLALVSVLADRRAAVWRAGVAARLGEVDAAGSAAMRRDTAALGQVQQAGLRYTGLAFAARDAALVSGTATAATLRVRVDTTAYVVVAPGGGRTARPSSRGPEVLVDLVWTPQGWRVQDVRAAAP